MWLNRISLDSPTNGMKAKGNSLFPGLRAFLTDGLPSHPNAGSPLTDQNRSVFAGMEPAQKVISFIVPIRPFLAVFTLENGTHTYRSRCPTLYLSLIERIEIHNPVRIDGHKRVQVNIYFTGVGRFKVPNEAELISLFNETQSA